MEPENHALGARRRTTGNVLIVVSSLLLVGSAAAKLAQVAPVVAQMSANGFSGGRLQVVAILELTSALLFLVPSTRSAGLLLLSAFLGGAIATHMGHGEPVAGPAIVLALVWLAAWLRHPEILWSARRAENAGRSTPQPRSEGLLQQL